MTTTLSFTATQAGEQITRDNVSWSALGTPVEITYGYRDTAPPSSYGSEAQSFSQVNAAEKAAVAATLAEWASVANISFKPVDPTGFTDSAVMLVANFLSLNTDGTTDTAAHAYLPNTKNMAFTSAEGDLWFNLGSDPYTDLSPGSYNYSTALHEIGHAIGLDHPGNYNAGGTQKATYENNAYYIEDTLQYSVMSYFDASKTGANHTFNGVTYQSLTPLRDDVAAIQRLYGANMTTRTGDTTYGFKSNADDQAFHISPNEQVIFTIWDAGGINTLDLSGYDTDQLIDLRPGAFSDAGSLTKNISIALGTVIQNGTGGTGADIIFGNDADNLLRGNAGNDTIYGGSGRNVSVYDGAERNYAVTITKGAAPFEIQDKVGGDGTDALSNIQTLQFSDQMLSAADFVKFRGLSLGDVTSVLDLYIAEDNRAPDALGLIYWGARLTDGMTLHQMAENFFGQPETRSLYPPTQSNSELVAAAYQNLFERAADEAGLAYWTAELNAGAVSRGVFLMDLADGARGADDTVLKNKEAVAAHFAMVHGLNNASWAKTVMDGVNATPASVTAANQQADAFAVTAAAPATTELVVKVVGIVTA